MIKYHPYLNFNGQCEEAFNFYSEIFQKPIQSIYKFKDMPQDPTMTISSGDGEKVMHASLQLNENTILMGSDCLESFGQKAVAGNNSYIMIDTDSGEEANRIYHALTVNAMIIEMPLGEQFWAELYASFQDQFGIMWMIHFEGNKSTNF
jgi:PhnB protein